MNKDFVAACDGFVALSVLEMHELEARFRTVLAPYYSQQNHLLAALPADEFERLLGHLDMVAFHDGWVVHESGKRLQHVYFPISGVVSLLSETHGGASAEVAVVGNEGLIGIFSFMRGDTTFTRAIVQCPGNAYQMKVEALRREYEHEGQLRLLLQRYSQTVLKQMALAAVCNRHHTVLQRFCRWLLTSLDRLPSNEISSTHEQISNLLGVRREAVTEAATWLKESGVIHYGRGHITVVKRCELEALACDCYAMARYETRYVTRYVTEHVTEHVTEPAPTHGSPGNRK